MWWRFPWTATRFRASRSGPRPWAEAFDLPDALLGPAGFALEPGFRTLQLHVARKEVTAGIAILGVGTGDRRNGAACAAAGIFPGGADLVLAALEHVDDGRPGK